MSHFILSMILLDSAFALAWCARYEPDERAALDDRLGVWAVRALVPLGQLTIVAGTIATASGPHAGSHGHELVKRFDFRGGDTLRWMVERHGAIAALFGIALCAVWLILRRSGGERRALRPLTVTIGLVGRPGRARHRPVQREAAGRARVAARRARHAHVGVGAVDRRLRRAGSSPARPAPPRSPARPSRSSRR